MIMEYFNEIFHVVAKAVDVAAMLLLTLAFLRGAAGWLIEEIRRKPWEVRVLHLRRLRCVVGLHILFALELMIVSDLIETVLILVKENPEGGSFFSSPAFFELTQLAVVVAIRTFIDYFLSKEIESLDEPILNAEPMGDDGGDSALAKNEGR